MFTTKNIYRNSWLLHLIVWLGVFSACTEIVDEPAMVKTRSLTMSRIAIADNVNVQTARVLVFDEYGALVTNIGPISNLEQDANNDNILNINTTNETDKILAKVGKNSVYVVLNEAAGITTDESNNVTWNLTAQLNAVKTKTEMETLRNTPIEYKEVIAVEGDTEPAFLMCVYDDEVIVTNQTETLDLTGLDEGDYGFSMRRSMAKIVLDEIIGGVTPDGKVIGLNTDWNKNIKVDQNTTDTDNNTLIGTSELFIQKVELINVPNTYSWKQNQNDTNETYNGGYHTTGMIITNGLKLTPSGFLDRTWPGDISASGTVGFDRTDYISGIWLQQTNSGTNSYGFTPVYFNITKGGYSSFYKNNPNGTVELNEGNFPPWLSENYAADGVEPGDIVPKDLELNQITINPAPWYIDVGKAYYIPENIPGSNDFNTKLRVYYKVANVAAEIDKDILFEVIQDNINNGHFDVVQNDGKEVDFSSDEGRAYLYSLGHWVFKEGSTTEAGYTWSGLTVKVSGTKIPVSGEKNGYYYASNDNVKYIDIDLNNDMVEGNYNENDYAENTYEGSIKPEGAEDHNIYRGREYHVKLYVTKQGAWNNQTNTASRTINIGGEELTITGKVVTKPMK